LALPSWPSFGHTFAATATAGEASTRRSGMPSSVRESGSGFLVLSRGGGERE
jgi:hypothetical protein